MTRKVALMCLMLCLSGCTPTWVERMDNGLDALVGKDMSIALDVMGPPDDIKESGDGTVYYWSVDKTVFPGDRRPTRDFSIQYYHPVTEYSEYQPIRAYCRIWLVADKNGKLMSYDYGGTEYGCEEYQWRVFSYLIRQNSPAP